MEFKKKNVCKKLLSDLTKKKMQMIIGLPFTKIVQIILIS